MAEWLTSSKLLITEPPLQVLPSLAAKIGLHRAIVLQQLHYWLIHSSHEHDGRRWIYNSYSQWQEQFPFWSERTIQRIFLSLERDGYILVSDYNNTPFDRTKWYTIDYEKLEELWDAEGNNSGDDEDEEPATNDKNGGPMTTNCRDDDESLSSPIPENNNTETNNKKIHTPTVYVSFYESSLRELSSKSARKESSRIPEPPVLASPVQEQARTALAELPPPPVPASPPPTQPAPTATSKKPRRAPKPEAVQFVENVIGAHFINKALYTRVEEIIAARRDPKFLRACYERWIELGYKPTNLCWLTQWYASGEIPGHRNNGYERRQDAAKPIPGYKIADFDAVRRAQAEVERRKQERLAAMPPMQGDEMALSTTGQ